MACGLLYRGEETCSFGKTEGKDCLVLAEADICNSPALKLISKLMLDST